MYIRCNKNVRVTKTLLMTQKYTLIRPLDKSNPVLELQSRGKQYRPAADPNEDDPPYNFQVGISMMISTFLSGPRLKVVLK